ncbi:hypothetical protein [Streptomyces coerulescens]|uniref:Uncharacterized protein n=1 Tax=Streptomyces coerulescens TaxID=29304 RepID=A0ABW0CZY9_STRCD
MDRFAIRRTSPEGAEFLALELSRELDAHNIGLQALLPITPRRPRQ